MRGLGPKGPLSGVLYPPKIESGYGPDPRSDNSMK